MDKALVEYLTEKGFEVIDSLSDKISTWQSWYAGAVDGFHDYKVYTGTTFASRTRASLQLGKSVSEQLANLLFNEKCKIAVNSQATQEFIDDMLDRNNMYIKLNESQEKKAALGTMCYIPYFTSDGLKMNYISADGLFPLSCENGVITELAVYSNTTSEGQDYIFLQLFTLEEDHTYKIQNILLETEEKGDKYIEVPLRDVTGYDKVEEEILTKSTTKPFVIDRLNIANNIDPDNPLGIAVFANAIDSMKFCDLVYDSYMNEFELGKKRVLVAAEAINMMSGSPVFDPNDLVYYQLPEGMNIEGKPFIHELNMTLRTTDHQQALHQGLNIFSSQCGLGENYYKYEGSSIATATQVISENNTLFRTLKKHEIILEAVLVDLVRLMVELGIKHSLATGLDPEAEVTVTFDDSIIEDKNTELVRMASEVAAGLIRPEIYLAYRYGKTEEEALKMMPPLPQMVEEGMP